MKRFSAIIVLIVYGYVLIQPLLPYVNYIANYDYIANELCENKDAPELECNGKCYLAKEITKVTQEQKDTPSVLKIQEVHKHTLSRAITTSLVFPIEKEFQFDQRTAIVDNPYSQFDAPPPECC